MNSIHCRVFDLCLSVPFPVDAELQAPADTHVDVYVELGDVPHDLPNAVHCYTYTDAGIKIEVDDHGNVLMHTAKAALLCGGRTDRLDRRNSDSCPICYALYGVALLPAHAAQSAGGVRAARRMLSILDAGPLFLLVSPAGASLHCMDCCSNVA